jgi:hypothetical protein
MATATTRDEVTPLADPAPPVATPVMMTDAYVEIGGANLKCLAEEISLTADPNPITVTTFCGVSEFPGPVKWHMVAKLLQAFDAGATDATLAGAVAAYASAGTPVGFKVRAYASRPASATNPSFEGNLIPQAYTVFGGVAGAASEVNIDWTMTAPPTRNVGTVVPATGATAGTPGTFTPSGATTPANLAGLSGVTASPNTAWATGQWVTTADAQWAHWSGTAWALGKA